MPEAVGRNVLVHSSWLLAQTERLVVATGIANIYGRDAGRDGGGAKKKPRRAIGQPLPAGHRGCRMRRW